MKKIISLSLLIICFISLRAQGGYRIELTPSGNLNANMDTLYLINCFVNTDTSSCFSVYVKVYNETMAEGNFEFTFPVHQTIVLPAGSAMEIEPDQIHITLPEMIFYDKAIEIKLIDFQGQATPLNRIFE